MKKLKIYAMVSENGHLLSMQQSLEAFVKQIIQMTKEEKDFYDKYTPIVFEETDDE